MPRELLLLHLRHDGRRRRFTARQHPHGVGGHRRFHRAMRDLRRFGGGWNRCHQGHRRHHQNGAASAPVQALEPAAQQLAPLMSAAAPVAPVEAPPPPGNDIIVIDDEDEVAPLPSPTLAVVEIAGDALAYTPAPTGASAFAFGSGMSSFSRAAAVNTGAQPRRPSSTPTTPPPSARCRLVALGLPLQSSPSSSRSRRAGTRSPTELGLANCAPNGVAPGTWLPGVSDDEDECGRSNSRRR